MVDAPPFRVLRGGSWSGSVPRRLLSSLRLALPGLRIDVGGFRCVFVASAADPKQATKDSPWENSLGMKFVPVKGTEVLFCIWHTRVQDFAAFVKDTGHDATEGMYSVHADGLKNGVDTWERPGFQQGPTHPVCGVSWEDAKAFCRWLTKKERAEGRLTAARQPTAGFNGADSFRFRASDGSDWSDASDVTITITPINDAPAPSDDFAMSRHGGSVVVQVLANDVDADGDDLAVVGVDMPAYGWVTLGAGGAVLYRSAVGWPEIERFAYWVDDGGGTPIRAWVIVVVQLGRTDRGRLRLGNTTPGGCCRGDAQRLVARRQRVRRADTVGETHRSGWRGRADRDDGAGVV